ncbi:MAG TPA: ATP-dependent DNA ligase [Candidatus Saccharimonadales bacterium]|nr:ATP-dependent DNA ligase [Candidatus Saccharimonadales bacterium]
MTRFSEFANMCRILEATRKRTAKVEVLSRFLTSLSPEEIVPTVSFITGHPLPESDDRVLDVGARTLWKIDKSSGQSTLGSNPITILDVYRLFEKIANTSGTGSRTRKEQIISSLLNRMPKSDFEYLYRIIFGEMRIGAVEGLVLESVSKISSINLEEVRRAYLLLGDPSLVAKLALTEGREGVRQVGVQLFLPIRPMLAEMANTVEEVLREHQGISAFEYKYDGARIQIHRKDQIIRIFSRRLTDVTRSLPDILDQVKTKVNCVEFLIEGEVVALGKNQKPLPFQDLMRRFRRIHNVELMSKEIPLQLFLFDLIYRDGRLLIDAPYEERWSLLQEIAPKELLTTRVITTEPDVAKSLMEASIEAGHEGLMAKDLKSTYTPGVRGKKWYKLKPAESLDLVIVAADWGSGRRRSWLSNYHLAARDLDTGEFLLVGKTFKGLTDEEFAEITKRLLELKIRQTDYTVFVRPEMVVEVVFNEIQKSPHYKSKFALRFARIIRLRNDKRAEDTDSIQRLQSLYKDQFKFKAMGDF